MKLGEIIHLMAWIPHCRKLEKNTGGNPFPKIPLGDNEYPKREEIGFKYSNSFHYESMKKVKQGK